MYIPEYFKVTDQVKNAGSNKLAEAMERHQLC